MKFDQYYDVYDEYSIAQQQVAKKLWEYMLLEEVAAYEEPRILEIGCGTGIFTRLYAPHYPKSKLYLNDVFDISSYVIDVPYEAFLQGPIESLDMPRVDLVVSSSALQWVDDLESLIQQVHTKTKHFCFAMYVKGNLQEINEHFGITLAYHDVETIAAWLRKYFTHVTAYHESIPLSFLSPMEALKHLKYTGVTGFHDKSCIRHIRSFQERTLTYEVGYFLCQ